MFLWDWMTAGLGGTKTSIYTTYKPNRPRTPKPMDAWRPCLRNEACVLVQNTRVISAAMPSLGFLLNESSSAHPMCATPDTKQQTLNSVPGLLLTLSAQIEVFHLSSLLFRPLMPGVSSVLWNNLPYEPSLYLELTLCLESTEYLLATLFQISSLCCMCISSVLPSTALL